jgi:hypothetical protein
MLFIALMFPGQPGEEDRQEKGRLCVSHQPDEVSSLLREDLLAGRQTHDEKLASH